MTRRPDRAAVELAPRELAALIAAMSFAGDQTQNAGWAWWHETRYVVALKARLREHLEALAGVGGGGQ